MKDIREKAIKYGTTDIQQIDAIDRFIIKALAKQKEEILDRLPKEIERLADFDLVKAIKFKQKAGSNNKDIQFGYEQSLRLTKTWFVQAKKALSQIKDIIKES